MAEGVIGNRRGAAGVTPNLRDYERACSAFSWEAESRELDGLPDGGLNIAHEAVDRHIRGPLRDQPALRFLGQDGAVEDYTYGRLHDLTNRFANLLRRLGIGAGDPVVTLLGPGAEQHIAALGTLKNRSVFCPLYAAFGPEPTRIRLNLSKAKILVTT